MESDPPAPEVENSLLSLATKPITTEYFSATFCDFHYLLTFKTSFKTNLTILLQNIDTQDSFQSDINFSNPISLIIFLFCYSFNIVGFFQGYKKIKVTKNDYKVTLINYETSKPQFVFSYKNHQIRVLDFQLVSDTFCSGVTREKIRNSLKQSKSLPQGLIEPLSNKTTVFLPLSQLKYCNKSQYSEYLTIFQSPLSQNVVNITSTDHSVFPKSTVEFFDLSLKQTNFYQIDATSSPHLNIVRKELFCSNDGVINIFDLKTGKLKKTLQLTESTQAIMGFVQNSNGSTKFVAAYHHDTMQLNEKYEITKHLAIQSPHRMIFSTDESLLFCANFSSLSIFRLKPGGFEIIPVTQENESDFIPPKPVPPPEPRVRKRDTLTNWVVSFLLPNQSTKPRLSPSNQDIVPPALEPCPYPILQPIFTKRYFQKHIIGIVFWKDFLFIAGDKRLLKISVPTMKIIDQYKFDHDITSSPHLFGNEYLVIYSNFLHILKLHDFTLVQKINDSFIAPINITISGNNIYIHDYKSLCRYGFKGKNSI